MRPFPVNESVNGPLTARGGTQVMADCAAMPVEGSRVRFNFDLARADSFQATLLGHTEREVELHLSADRTIARLQSLLAPHS